MCKLGYKTAEMINQLKFVKYAIYVGRVCKFTEVQWLGHALLVAREVKICM